MGVNVVATVRNTWHVIEEFTGRHGECENAAEVQDFVARVKAEVNRDFPWLYSGTPTHKDVVPLPAGQQASNAMGAPTGNAPSGPISAADTEAIAEALFKRFQAVETASASDKVSA